MGETAGDYESGLSEAYIAQIETLDPNPADVAVLEECWQTAPLPHQDGETLPYVRLGAYNEGHKPVFYVPGFTEGIEAKAPFGIEMARAGFDIIVPGQNRESILKDAANKKNPTYSQALNYLAVIEAEGLQNEPMDIAAHSYGSLIFEEMVREAEARGWTCFDDARVAFLAPAGTNEDEGFTSLGVRFARSIISEGDKTPKDFPDSTGEMLKAGTGNFMANIPRALREMLHLFKEKVDYGYLALRVGKIAVFSYGEDRLFPFRVQAATLERVSIAGVSYATPYSQVLRPDGTMRGADNATHNDEQFNPERVAGAVSDFLGDKFI
jgi:hypothetical protein